MDGIVSIYLCFLLMLTFHFLAHLLSHQTLKYIKLLSLSHNNTRSQWDSFNIPVLLVNVNFPSVGLLTATWNHKRHQNDYHCLTVTAVHNRIVSIYNVSNHKILKWLPLSRNNSSSQWDSSNIPVLLVNVNFPSVGLLQLTTRCTCTIRELLNFWE